MSSFMNLPTNDDSELTGTLLMPSRRRSGRRSVKRTTRRSGKRSTRRSGKRSSKRVSRRSTGGLKKATALKVSRAKSGKSLTLAGRRVSCRVSAKRA